MKLPNKYCIILESPEDMGKVRDTGLVDLNHLNLEDNEYHYPTTPYIEDGIMTSFCLHPNEFTLDEWLEMTK